MEYYYLGHGRLDWGFENPNKSAALIACLALFSWLPALARPQSRILFFTSLIGFLVFSILLTETYSRGGFVSLAVGILPIVYFLRKHYRWLEKGCFIAGLLAIIGYSVINESVSRTSISYLKSDASAGNRVDLYSQVPHLMAKTPEGVGKGFSGLHFRQHYQGLERNERYRTLVSFHATTLVEAPWWGRLLYAPSWALLLGLFIPRGCEEKSGIYFVGLAVTLCTFTANIFSTIGEAWQTWLPLVGMTCVVLGVRLFQRHLMNGRVTARLMALALILTASVHILGLLQQGHDLKVMEQAHYLYGVSDK